jgi:uncharacterized protein YndB with AHSA1/START domain
MAVSETRDILIEAPVSEIFAVLSDPDSLPEWSDVHQTCDVLERDDQGRPTRTRMKVRTAGITDEQVLDYTWHDDGLSWTLKSAKQQRSQEARYTLTPEGDTTRVRFELTIDPLLPLPRFLLKRATKGVMGTATKGLRKRVLSRNKAG